MNKIQNFAKTHTIIYCILAEIIVLGGMLLSGVVIGLLFGKTGVDGYILQTLQEVVGALLALVVLEVSGCGDVLRRRGIGFGRGLLVGGYFLFIGVYSAIVYVAAYEGQRTLRPWYLIAVFLICMVLVGITEEFLCRGVLAELLLRRFGATKEGVWKAVVISGVLFGLAHLSNLFGAEPVGVLVQCVVAAMIGMAFAAIYFRTGCIWVTVALHAFVDICALITGGLYTGALAETISGYQPIQLIGVVPYVILLCVLLRKKKMNEMIARMNQNPDENLSRHYMENQVEA